MRAAFFERLRTAASSTPGVASAATSALTPVSGGMWNNEVLIPGGPALSERERVTYINLVSPDWLRTYGTRLLAGRDIALTDQSGTAPIALVNEAFVRKFFNGENPVGRRVGRPAFPGRPGGERQIVGYVADAVYNSLREPVPPTMYIPITQQPEAAVDDGDQRAGRGWRPALLARGLTAALSAVSGDLAITLRPLDDQIEAALTQERVVAFMSAFFGVLALLLAGLGLYGVTAYAVSRRRAEIGIRMALGAAPGGVLRLVLARVALLVGIGAVLGSALSIWAARFVTTLLYGLRPRVPVTLVAARLMLMMVGGGRTDSGAAGGAARARVRPAAGDTAEARASTGPCEWLLALLRHTNDAGVRLPVASVDVTETVSPTATRSVRVGFLPTTASSLALVPSPCRSPGSSRRSCRSPHRSRS